MPVNWHSRWKFIRIFIPLMAFTAICLAEQVGLTLWKQDRFELTALAIVLVVPLVIMAFLLVLNEIKLRGGQGSGRFLNVIEKGISFQPGGRPLIRWPKVTAFWFEDIPGEAQLSKVTIEYFGDRKTRLPRRQPMALDKKTQCPALLAELKLLQQQHGLGFRIEPQQAPPGRPVPRNLVLGLSLSLAGFLFVMHGVPLLMLALSGDSKASHPPDSNDRWSPKQQQMVHDFIHGHFSSKAEFKKFLLVTGGGLTAVGVALMGCGIMVQRPKKDGVPARASRDA